MIPLGEEVASNRERPRERRALTGFSHGGRAPPDRRRGSDVRVRDDVAVGAPLDAKTISLLEYAEKLTKVRGMIDDGNIDALRAAGWSEDAI